MSSWVSDLFANQAQKILKHKSSKKKVNDYPPSLSNKDQSMAIGGPTDFEHGIHIEFNGKSGRFLGVPDVWETNVPAEELTSTKTIDPNLVPKTKKQIKTKGKQDIEIGLPFEVKHNMHVNFDSYGNASAIGITNDLISKFAQSGVVLNEYNPSALPQRLDSKPAEPLTRRYSKVKAIRRSSLAGNSNTLAPSPTNSNHSNRKFREPSLLEKALDKAARESLEIPQSLKKLSQISDTSTLNSRIYSGSTVQSTPQPTFIDVFQLRPYIVDSELNPIDRFGNPEPIAEGESGDVHKAVDSKSGKPVAIKIINFTMNEKMSRLQAELHMMKTNNHPNLIAFFGCYTTPESLWLTMELMDLGPLTDIVSCYPHVKMAEPEIARVSYDVLSALAFLERLNRIHRDIMSDNILINSQGNIKLADFAKAADIFPGRPNRNSAVSTLYWMAPEMAKGNNYNFKVDIWSFGILLLEMAEGEPPLMGADAQTAKESILSGSPPELSDPLEWGDNFKDFVSSTLTIDSQRRPSATFLLEHPFLKSRSASSNIVELYNKSLEFAEEEEEEQ